jgi:pimeloyl-ACP methyl ester carboxylesterase
VAVTAPSHRASGLDGLFNARVRFGVGSALADERATVVFEVPGAGIWSLILDSGRVSLRRGAARHPAAHICTDPDTMCAILEGEVSGVQAFLGGRLKMRGNISLALQVDGAFDFGPRPATHPRLHVTEVDRARTSYLDAGPRDGRPVVLLHGLGATNASMLPLVPGLAERYRVIAPDTPGFGASDAPNWNYSIGRLGRWLHGFLRAVGAQRPALVGNSLGGRIAIEAALEAPERVDRLVLLCPSPAFRRLRQFVPAVRLVKPDVGRIPVWMSHRLTVESIRLMFARPDRLPREWYDAAADEFCRVMARPAHRRAFIACLCQIYTEPAYGENGFWDRLPGLTTPALFLWGERDRLVPARFARHVVQALPNARSQILGDCGHVPQYELPADTLRLTRQFLAARQH